MIRKEMNEYRNKYRRIVDKLIGKSFPGLKGAVRVFELKFTKLYGVYIPWFNLVGVNKLCRDFPEKEIKGILAHELSHAEYFKDFGFFNSLWFFIRYWFSPKLRKDEEDRADRATIDKGYARELVLSASRLEKLYPKYKDKTYMSIKKIKSYAKKVRKW